MTAVVELAAQLSVDDAVLPQYPETHEQAHARASKALDVWNECIECITPHQADGLDFVMNAGHR